MDQKWHGAQDGGWLGLRRVSDHFGAITVAARKHNRVEGLRARLNSPGVAPRMEGGDWT
jgi:hypothetical protein